MTRAEWSPAVDRLGLVRSALGGHASVDDGPIPPAVRWAALPPRRGTFDRAAAEQELDAAGWTRNGRSRSREGKLLQLRLIAPTGAPYTAVSRALERDLATVGILTTPRSLGAEGLLAQLQSRDFELALTALDNGPDPDIYALWHSSQEAAGGFNFSGMAANSDLDRALDEGRSTADYGKRRVAYLEAQKQVLGAHAAVFLYSPEFLVGVRDVVRGVTLPTGGQRYDRAQDWYLKTSLRG
ncbi:MAG: hypothetical protein NVSMB17_07680 [Candidatus Dormibacteria bacterium]